jgi:hypothetical protein
MKRLTNCVITNQHVCDDIVEDVVFPSPSGVVTVIRSRGRIPEGTEDGSSPRGCANPEYGEANSGVDMYLQILDDECIFKKSLQQLSLWSFKVS